MKRACILTLFLFWVGACGPKIELEDEAANDIIASVAMRVAPFHDCVEVTKNAPLVYYENLDMAPPSANAFEKFENADVVADARKAATPSTQVDWEELDREKPIIFGAPNYTDDFGPGCSLRVLGPTFARDHAFVRYFSPGGSIGLYAYGRDGDTWRKVDHVYLG